MPQIRTFCRVCEPACGLVAHVDGEWLERVTPDRDHPISAGWACNKGIATFDIHHDPDRLNHPMKRTASGRFEPIGWDQAIAEISDRLRAIHARTGNWSTAFYVGNPTAFNALVSVGLTPFATGLGSRQVYSSGTQDCSNKFAGSEYVYGSSTIHPVPDFDHTRYLLVLGSNPGVSHMSFVSIADPINVLRAAEARGAKVVFVNPRRIESVKSGVGSLVLIRPDSDVYFLAALLHELDRQGGFDDEILRAHGTRVAELRQFLAAYPPERVAEVTGIAADTVRQIAHDWRTADGASVTMSTGVNMGRQGTLAYWLVQMLSFCTGNLDRRGGNIESVGYYPSAPRAGTVDPATTYFDSRFGRQRRVRGSLPGNLLAEDLLTAGPGQPRALFVVAGNPILSVGGEARLAKGLEGLELVVSIDLYRNATGEFADYLLPATDQFERADVTYAGLGLQHRPHVQFTERVVPPRHERREEWRIFGALCQALGFKGPLDAGDDPAPFARIGRMLERGGLSLEQVRATPGGVMLPPHAPGRFFAEQIATPDGRVDCCPPLFAEAFVAMEQQLLTQLAPGPRSLRLITKRDRFMHNSWFHNIDTLKRGERSRNWLFMHSADADARGLIAGELVAVSSAAGTIELPLKLDDDLMPGVVAATHGWGHEASTGLRLARERPGVNVNRLLPIGLGSFDPLSNQAHMTGVDVEVTVPRARSAAVVG